MDRNTGRKHRAQREKSQKNAPGAFRTSLLWTIAAKTRLGACRARFWRVWEPPGPVLGASGALLGSFWAALGHSWASLGRLLDASWPVLVASGLSWRAPGSILRGSGRLQGGFSSLRACIFRGFCMRARLAPSAPYLRPELAYVVTAMPLGPAAETLSTAFFTACSLPGVLPWMFFTMLKVAVFESFRRVP